MPLSKFQQTTLRQTGVLALRGILLYCDSVTKSLGMEQFGIPASTATSECWRFRFGATKELIELALQSSLAVSVKPARYETVFYHLRSSGMRVFSDTVASFEIIVYKVHNRITSSLILEKTLLKSVRARYLILRRYFNRFIIDVSSSSSNSQHNSNIFF